MNKKDEKKNERQIFNRYAGWRKYVMRGRFLRKAAYFALKPRLKRKIRNWMQTPSLFSSVEIETINRCNGECPFCPVNRHDENRPYALMTEELFDRIVKQLGEMGFAGSLSLHSNNEPFLDKRIIDFARRAREVVPLAAIQIYTNGSLLTEEKLLQIMPFLDRLVIDNYDDQLQLTEQSKMVLRVCEQKPELQKKIEIHLRKVHEVLYTRGGQAPNNDKKEVFHMPCTMPFGQFIIRPDGKISLCCNDARGKYTLGDCNVQRLEEIWFSEGYNEIRRQLAKGRDTLPLCRYCDTFSL